MEHQSTRTKEESDLQPVPQQQKSSRKTVAARNRLEQLKNIVHGLQRQLNEMSKNKKQNNNNKSNKKFQEIQSSKENYQREIQEIEDELSESVSEKIILGKIKNIEDNKQLNTKIIQSIEPGIKSENEHATISELLTNISSNLTNQEEISSLSDLKQEFKDLSQAPKNKEESLLTKVDFLFKAYTQLEKTYEESRTNLKTVITAYQNQEKIVQNLQDKEIEQKYINNNLKEELTHLSQRMTDIEITIMKTSLTDLVYETICQNIFGKSWSEFSSSQQKEVDQTIKETNWKSFNQEAERFLKVDQTLLNLLRMQKDVRNNQFHKPLEYIIENKNKVIRNPNESKDSQLLFYKCLVAMQKEDLKVEKTGKKEKKQCR